MEDRVRLRVMGLSYNQLQNGAFALLLAEMDGPMRIPVVIGAAEAQAIAIKMEGITPQRPLTHDLFMSFSQAFGIRLREVFIYKFADGMFYSELTFDDGDRRVVLDARTSDAIAIAMRCNAPIFTTRAIVEETGFVIENEPGNEPAQTESKSENDETDNLLSDEPAPERLAIEELEKLLARLIEDEDYEQAAKISEIIKRKKGE
ncbi:MAG: DUF151 domain-containing protein [Muribaculaceae bacterium]|nr:DUF151 domain-containing protein [Muribaculaceae bacterium]